MHKYKANFKYKYIYKHKLPVSNTCPTLSALQYAGAQIQIYKYGAQTQSHFQIHIQMQT